jgi:hypothetical protein
MEMLHMCNLAGIFLLLISSWLHPVHVSLLNVDLNTSSGEISLTFKFFSDDFETIIYQRYGKQLDIVNQTDPGDQIQTINNYLKETFRLEVNGTRIEAWKYDRNEMNHEAIWLFYNGSYDGKMKSVSVNYESMMDLFIDQTNLVIVTYDGLQNGYRLNNKNRQLTFNIKK